MTINGASRAGQPTSFEQRGSLERRRDWWAEESELHHHVLFCDHSGPQPCAPGVPRRLRPGPRRDRLRPDRPGARGFSPTRTCPTSPRSSTRPFDAAAQRLPPRPRCRDARRIRCRDGVGGPLPAMRSPPLVRWPLKITRVSPRSSCWARATAWPGQRRCRRGAIRPQGLKRHHDDGRRTAMLTGKVALVTGATRGAGRGTAVALGEAGATVYCTGRTTRERRSDYDRPEPIEETAELVSAASAARKPGVGGWARRPSYWPDKAPGPVCLARRAQGALCDPRHSGDIAARYICR